MKDIAVAARRAVESLVDVQVLFVLFASAACWAFVNTMTAWLLIGPALVSLFGIALRALREEDLDLKRENLAWLDDPATPIVAGFLFVLPFHAWALVNAQSGLFEKLLHAVSEDAPEAVARSLSDVRIPGVPFVATLALFVHFAYHVLAFAVIAERRGTLGDAFRRARALAERGGGQGRFRGLTRHLAVTSAVLLALLPAISLTVLRALGEWTGNIASGLVMVLLGPLAIAVLAAWHLQVSRETSDGAPGPAPGEPDAR